MAPHALIQSRRRCRASRLSLIHIFSALVGIALAEGHIASLDDPLTRYLPELAATDARFSNVTLRHLLLMRSGIAFDEGYRSPLSDAARFYLSRDLAARVRALKIEGAPDRIQAYRSGDTQFLGMVLALSLIHISAARRLPTSSA